MLKDSRVMKKVTAIGEKQFTRLAQQLFSNERFAQALQRVVMRAFDAKGAVDQRIARVLSAMRLATTKEVTTLERRIAGLETEVRELREMHPRKAEAKGNEKAEARA